MALALRICLLGCLFQSSLPQPSFFLRSSSSPLDCFVLLSISSSNLPSLFPPHHSHPEVSQLALRAADNLLWNYCKSCAGIWNLSLSLSLSLSLRGYSRLR
jgi:hypothetical protein